MGLEPTTFGTTIRRADQLHHIHHILFESTNFDRLTGSVNFPHHHRHILHMSTSPGGFEPSTYGLEGRCSIQLSYGLITSKLFALKKAGDGNRTHVSSLEGWCSTIELHPQGIGVTGFEPATSWSQTRRSSQAEPHPVIFLTM